MAGQTGLRGGHNDRPRIEIPEHVTKTIKTNPQAFREEVLRGSETWEKAYLPESVRKQQRRRKTADSRRT